ncbi:MAG: DMT family transporter [Anaerolineales bacterium]|jgi:drug/metabolite transporter (DMT)-like permease
MLAAQVQGILSVILATACWSLSGIFINLIVQNSDVSPVGLAFYRDVSTSVSLLVGILLFRRDLFRVKGADIPWLFAMGAISIGLFHVLWNSSVIVNGAAIATVFQSNAPIFVSVAAWFIWGEPLTSRKFIAIGLSIIGTLFIALPGNLGGIEITIRGLLIALASAIAYGTFSLFGKMLTGNYSLWTIMLFIFGFASFTLLPFQFGLSTPSPDSPVVYTWFAGLILISTISGFGLFTYGLSRLQASVASITATTEVPFAAIMAYFFLGERLNFLQILGALCVIGGIILISLPNRKSMLQKLKYR